MIQVCFHWMPYGKYCQHRRNFADPRHADNFINYMERKYPKFTLDEVFTEKKEK